MYLLTPFILQNFKKTLRVDPQFWKCTILEPKTANFPEQFFFGTKNCCYFHLPLGPFHCEKFKKILTADPELQECTILGSKIVHSPQLIFFRKIIIILICLLATFIVQNLKKILPADSELWGCAISGPKMAHFLNENFFRKPVNEYCFFHSCLSTCQKSKSDINILVKYWWLKNTEI